MPDPIRVLLGDRWYVCNVCTNPCACAVTASPDAPGGCLYPSTDNKPEWVSAQTVEQVLVTREKRWV